MAAGVHWLEPGSDDHPADDIVAPPGGPHWTRWALLAAGAVLVVTVAVATWPDSSSTPAHPTTSPADTAPDIPRTVGAQSAAQVAVAQVGALAVLRGPATDFVRQTSAPGSCPLVRPGRSPAHDIAVTARALLPEVHLVTIGRTLDQFTGLCSIQLRGTVAARRVVQSSGPPARGVVVVDVAAPPPAHITSKADRVRSGEVLEGATTTRYVVAELRTGWTVLVGARGEASRLPSVQTLQTLAVRQALTWSP